jgi:hypothetical protein
MCGSFWRWTGWRRCGSREEAVQVAAYEAAAGSEPAPLNRIYLLPRPTKTTPATIRKRPTNFRRVSGSLKKRRDQSSVKM